MRVALALIVFLCCTANANAATVQYTQAPPQDPADHGAGKSSLVDLVARPGEVNDIDVTDTDQVVVIRDACAPLAAGSGCRAQSYGSVQCPRGDVSVEVLSDRELFAIIREGSPNRRMASIANPCE